MNGPAAIAAAGVGMALPFACAWWRARRWGENVSVHVVEGESTAEDVAGYFAEVARSLDERPRRMVLRFFAPAGAQLDATADGERLVSRLADDAFAFSLRHRWIADHPLPLTLGGTRLFVEPVDANRFRAMSRLPDRGPWPIVAMVTLCALVTAFTLLVEPLVFAAAWSLATRLAGRV